jgi:phosphate transport system permease protein
LLKLTPGKYDTQTLLYERLGLDEAEMANAWNHVYSNTNLTAEEEILSVEYRHGSPYDPGTSDFQFKIEFASRRVIPIAMQHIPIQVVSINSINPMTDITSVYSGSYPFSRKIHLVTRQNPSSDVDSIISSLLTPEGQDLLENIGFLLCQRNNFYLIGSIQGENMQTKAYGGRINNIVFLILALIPVIMLGFIIVQLIMKSGLAVSTLGFKGLFSTEISGVLGSNKGLYGLIPAIWGTVLLMFVSLAIAIPVSLALAILSSEFTLGFFSKGLRTLIGILGGIPPVIYALMSAVFAKIFIIPKFAGAGIPVDSLPVPIQSLPYSTSTLLGGIMISLLVIPFLAPLFDDAIRNVPHSLKEAGLSLGANRWHILWSVTIPAAFSGLLSACSLGALKVMGDVVIVGLVIGFESGLPSPLFDILQSTAPLTSTAAGFSGGFTQTAKSPLRESVAYFTSLILLIIAFITLIAVPLIQKQFKRKYS